MQGPSQVVQRLPTLGGNCLAKQTQYLFNSFSKTIHPTRDLKKKSPKAKEPKNGMVDRPGLVPRPDLRFPIFPPQTSPPKGGSLQSNEKRRCKTHRNQLQEILQETSQIPTKIWVACRTSCSWFLRKKTTQASPSPCVCPVKARHEQEHTKVAASARRRAGVGSSLPRSGLAWDGIKEPLAGLVCPNVLGGGGGGDGLINPLPRPYRLILG